MAIIHFSGIASKSLPMPTMQGMPSVFARMTECEVTEFFAMLEEISGVRATRLVLPFRAAWLVARALERFHLVPDPVVVEMAAHWWGLRSLHSAEELDWKPRNPRETLRDTVEWLRCFGPS